MEQKQPIFSLMLRDLHDFSETSRNLFLPRRRLDFFERISVFLAGKYFCAVILKIYICNIIPFRAPIKIASGEVEIAEVFPLHQNFQNLLSHLFDRCPKYATKLTQNLPLLLKAHHQHVDTPIDHILQNPFLKCLIFCKYIGVVQITTSSAKQMLLEKYVENRIR